jgi:Transposase IS116/IS110/IS902 family
VIAQPLAPSDFLDARLERVSAEIAERLRPFEGPLERRQPLAGVGRRPAEGLRAEIGSDRTRFPSAGPLASWAGLCPGNDERAGKRRAAADAPAEAVPGGARPSWKQRRPPRAPKTPTEPLNIGDWRHAEEPSARQWR